MAYLRGTPFGSAIGMVFDCLSDWDYADDGYSVETGVLKVRDLDGLLADLALDRETVAGHPRSLVEDGVLIWPSCARIVA